MVRGCTVGLALRILRCSVFLLSVSASALFAYPTTLAHPNFWVAESVEDAMGRSLWHLDSIVMRFSFVVLYFATFALAQHLAFLQPDLTPVTSGSSRPHYTVGQDVTISWTTPFEETNLLVYQLKETAYAYDVLALNYGQNVTFYVWSAAAVGGQPLNTDHPFHFVLENGKSYSCVGCVTQSPQFDVQRAQQQEGTTTSSPSTSATRKGATPTSQPRTAQTQTQTHQTHEQSSTPSASGASGQQQQQDQSTPAPSSSKSHHDMTIGLGVGLGVGIPLLLAIAGLCYFLALRRQKKRRRVSYHPTGSGNWTTDQAERPESGALGRWQSQRSERGQSRASGLSQMSHNSWIDPFEFEKPGMRDQDALSQLRQSIHSSGSDSHVKEMSIDTPRKASSSREPSWPLSNNTGNEANKKYAWMGGTAGAAKASNGWGAGTAAARRSDVSWANTDMSSLEGMPEQMQPVHHRYGSPTGHDGYTSPSRGDGRDWPLP